MSKNNRKANRRQTAAQTVNPFEQYLCEQYADVVSEAYARYQQTLLDAEIFDGLNAIRYEWQQDAAAAVAAQKLAAKKAAKTAAKAQQDAVKAAAVTARNERIATLRAKFFAICVYSLPIMLVIASLTLRK